ncbi:unnamed protein product [Amoebophrya sp. A25]|nr:unnamed protein product [Amoebophrya sp. A25]|eukprot:GSA25T00006973001.1
MGFDGKLSLHPTQIVQLGKLFSPTPEQMREAANIVRIFDDQDNKAGAAVYKGQMIDLPHYTRAKKIIARGEAAGIEAAADEKVGKAEEVFPRVHHGKYLEDLTPGLRVRHALTRTVTEADNVLFTCLSLNPAPIHLDHELCKNTEFGKPLFNSMFTLALLVGMSVLETTHGTTIANLGFSGVKFPYPVYPGDTLRAETLIVDARESASRPTQGIVTLEHSMFNQEGKLVCVCTRQALMKKKPVAKM